MNQAKNAGSKRESDMPIHAYVIMLHLTSQGYSNFIEMRKVLCRNTAGSYYIVLLAYIVKKIEELEEEWGESMPKITALVFDKYGKASKWTCEQLSDDGESQPTLQ